MIINYMLMKKVNYLLSQLNNDKKLLIFCLTILFTNLFYLYQNDDTYIIFGYGYGLEKLLNLNQTPNPVLNMNIFFLRGFSYLSNLIVFNFIFLMLYNIIFKTLKSVKFEALFIYAMNILLALAILCFYITMS